LQLRALQSEEEGEASIKELAANEAWRKIERA
jgi:hypothetical protein